MGTCLERFGLPMPDMQNRIQKIPRVIQEELFDVHVENATSEVKCQHLNADQHDAFVEIMQAMQDDNCPERMFF